VSETPERTLDSAEVAGMLEGAQARLGDDLRPDSRAKIIARICRLEGAASCEDRQGGVSVPGPTASPPIVALW